MHRGLLALTLAWLACTSPAHAVDSAERSAARQLAQQGVEAYQAEDYGKALDKLERAYQTLPTPVLALWCARTLEKLGRWVEASELYLQATRIAIDRQGDAQVQEDARKEAAVARERLAKRIPVLVVELEGAAKDAEVRVGERVLGAALIGADLPTDPGLVHITARSGEQTVEREVRLSEGERKVVSLTFEPGAEATATEATKPAPAAATTTTPVDDNGRKGSWQKPTGWIAIGLGAASIGVGAGFGFDAIAKNDASDPHCDAMDFCDPTGTDLRNSGLTSAAISTTTIAVGSALAAFGVVLLLTGPRGEKATSSLHLAPTLGGAGLSWRGEF